MNEEFDSIDEFLGNMVAFIDASTYWQTYAKMSEESRRKYVEKLTFLICVEFSPKRNYNISKNTIREMVINVLEVNRRLGERE
jgi:hypothetical protein